MTTQEKDVSIAIEVGPQGIVVRVDYIGPLSSIPAAIERLRTSGVLELLSAARPAPAHTNGRKARVEHAEPEYDSAGDECCPTHHRKLRGPNQWGKLYCTAKDGDAYCTYTWQVQ